MAGTAADPRLKSCRRTPKGDRRMGRRAVILAGGKGSRLGPYTTVLPKPLLPVGDRAILDVVVHQLRDAGFDDLTLAVGYLSHLVRAVMGDGSTHGVSIDYHEEVEPLGTVGPLATIDRLDDSFLMMNGDVLTALDYAQLRGRPPRERQRPDDRLPPPRGAHRVRRDPPRRQRRRDPRGHRLRGEARDPLHREHGRLRAGARAPSSTSSPISAWTCPTSSRACSRRTSRWAPTSTTATGSTSGATRTTRRRSSSSSRSSPS